MSQPPTPTPPARPVPRALGAAVRAALGLAPRAGARWATRIFLTPRPARVRDAERAVLDAARPGTLTAGGRRIATYAWGDGPAVLLVHGWNGHAGQLTGLVAPLVARGYRAIAIDNPGHGASGRGVTHVGEAGDAVAAVAAAVGDVHAVIAHSAGATACALATAHGLAPARHVYLGAAVVPRRWVAGFGAVFGLSPDAVEAVAAEVTARCGQPLEALELRRFGAAMRAPALFLHDPADAIAPLRDVTRAAAAMPDARIVEVAGPGHYRIVADPIATAAAIEFVTAAAPARRAAR